MIFQLISISVGLGAAYGLIGLGFSLTYRTTGLLNFAQGAFAMMGGMLAAFAASSLGLGLWLSLAFGVAAATTAGIAFALIAVLPLWRRGGSGILMTLSSFLFLVAAENTVLNLMGSDPRSVPAVLGPTHIGGVRVDGQTVVVVVSAAVLAVLLNGFLRRSRAGLAMRSVAVDRDVSKLMGMSPLRMAVLAIGIGAALGAVAGILIAPIQFTSYSIGLSYDIKGLLAALVGGLGRLNGALIGGLVVGTVETLLGVYVTTAYLDAGLAVFLLIFLLVNPSEGI